MAAMNPDEIISILKEEIKNYDEISKDQEVGTVISVGDGIATVHGIDHAMYGEVVTFENGLKGMVQDIRANSIGCILFGKDTGIKEGTKVARTQKQAGVPVGDAFIGIGKNLISLVYFLEFFFAFFIAGMQIRVIFFGTGSVCLFYFIVACALLNAKHLVVVSFVCHITLTFVKIPKSRNIASRLSSYTAKRSRNITAPLTICYSNINYLLSSTSVKSASYTLGSPPLLPVGLPPFG